MPTETDYATLAALHASVTQELLSVKRERNDLRSRITQITGEVFPADTAGMGGVGLAAEEPRRKARRMVGATGGAAMDAERTVTPGLSSMGTEATQIRQLSRSGSLTEDDLTLFEIKFDDEVFQTLSNLFSAMDTQNQGYITAESFTTGQWGGMITGAFGEWEKIRLMFDRDNSNSIDAAEFVDGFALLALRETINIQPNTYMTLEGFYRQMESMIKETMHKQIMSCAAEVTTALGARSSFVRGQSYILPNNLVYRAQLKPEVCVRMGQTFKMIDKTGRGEIRLDDFTNAGKTLGTWEDVRQQFDRDGNGVIDQKEFLEGFKGWLLASSLPLPSSGTISDFLVSVHETACNKVMSDLTTFEQQLANAH
eukprot:CAMPEP_0119519900 /NCGR_PEP_ID=MMETSP1344-20130328/36058_1 /TAXON_ID=236787 /ORGANISM="Florenciella parvula, Strain CCMP2471" /LENGTH=367 /DNA_ID=CAMNT_0007557725 /DNA_START=36 /DNA_END=1139 /DNA_ORIENTATION=-